MDNASTSANAPLSGKNPPENGPSSDAPLQPSHKRFPVLLAFAFLAPLAVALRSIASPDFWMRLASGRLVAAEGILRSDPFREGGAERAWVHSTWLYDRLLYGLWQWGGATAIVVIHATLVVASLALFTRVALRWASSQAIALALALSAWLLFPHYRVGPAIPGLFLAAVFTLVLSNGLNARRQLPFLIPLQLLWANLGPSFLLGPLLAALAAKDQATRVVSQRQRRPGRETSDLASPFRFLGGLLLATAFNPYMVAVHRLAARLLRYPPPSGALGLVSPLGFWFSTTAFQVAFWAALALLAIGLITHKGRLPLLLVLPAFGSAFTAFRDINTLPYFALLGFPFLALSLQSSMDSVLVFFRYSASSRPWARGVQAGTVIAVLGTTVLISTGWADRISGNVSRPGFSAEEASFPDRAIEYLRQEEIQGSLFSLPYDGGYLCWRLPGRRVYTDPRKELYDFERSELTQRLLAGDKTAMADLLDSADPVAMVISVLWPGAPGFVRNQMEDPQWSLTYVDGVSAVLVRRNIDGSPRHLNPALAQQALAELEEELRTAQARIEQGERPRLSPRLAGAAFLLAALEQHESALEMLNVMEKTAPRMRTIALLQGITLVRLERHEEALAPLQAYTRRHPNHRQAWFWLAQAQAALGHEEEARKAEARSR